MAGETLLDMKLETLLLLMACKLFLSPESTEKWKGKRQSIYQANQQAV